MYWLLSNGTVIVSVAFYVCGLYLLITFYLFSLVFLMFLVLCLSFCTTFESLVFIDIVMSECFYWLACAA